MQRDDLSLQKLNLRRPLRPKLNQTLVISQLTPERGKLACKYRAMSCQHQTSWLHFMWHLLEP